MLDYEKLDVYQCAIKFLAMVFKWLPRLPRGYASLVDQWRRSAVRLLDVISEPELIEGKGLVVREVEMLTKMCR